MANVKSTKKEEVRNETVEQVSSVEKFYNSYKKCLWGTLIAILVLGCAFLAYNKWVYIPACAEAQGQMYPAEQLFAQSNYETALNGDGNILGFAQIIDEYGAKAGKSVYMYAGVCALQLGNFEDALAYLKKYNGKDPILAPRAKACEGDALVGMGETHYAEAVKCYEKAASMQDNAFAANYIFKAGTVYEAMGNAGKALECYEKIQEKYPQSVEAADIVKYIARVKAVEE